MGWYLVRSTHVLTTGACLGWRVGLAADVFLQQSADLWALEVRLRRHRRAQVAGEILCKPSHFVWRLRDVVLAHVGEHAGGGRCVDRQSDKWVVDRLGHFLPEHTDPQI